MNDRMRLTELEEPMILFAQELIRIRSYSGCEQEIAVFVKRQMERLGYDDVKIDEMGNVIGRIGEDRDPAILLDSHMDTVEVKDGACWTKPPFGGEIHDGRLYGRGAVDMKSALAACVFAGAAARERFIDSGKTAYVTCSVCEECCDGEALRYILQHGAIHPSSVLICEPSGNQIMLGHKGKMQTFIISHGVSAHGATPQYGKNAVYEMAGIIERVAELNALLQADGDKGSVTLSNIFCTSASPNAVPDSCSIRLDRRLAWGETEQNVIEEMEALVRGKQASWVCDEIKMKSWTGCELCYKPLHLAWQIANDHPFTQTCLSAYRNVFSNVNPSYGYWDFSTNAVAPISLGIPTIGFGPGDPAAAHTSDESCSVTEIIDAFRFYTSLLALI
jgi:putative selenium metabolism hydrolase